MSTKEELQSFLEIFEDEHYEIKKIIESAEKIDNRLTKIINKLEDQISLIEEIEFKKRWG